MPLPYTDIACEIYSKSYKNLPHGVNVSSYCAKGIRCTQVEITKQGLRREKGKYITFDMPNLAQIEPSSEAFVCAIAEQIRKLCPKNGVVLVAGIGNRAVMPDSLGPATVDKVFVTNNENIKQLPIRRVAAVSPGVAGTTGISTCCIIKGIINEISPACVVLVDSLCTSSPLRMGSSVQISNTGLKPQNSEDISGKSLGVPVVAIGVPTIANWKIEHANKTLTVTPKDIDTIIQKASSLLALAINKALQPALSVGELCFLTS